MPLSLTEGLIDSQEWKWPPSCFNIQSWKVRGRGPLALERREKGREEGEKGETEGGEQGQMRGERIE